MNRTPAQKIKSLEISRKELHNKLCDLENTYPWTNPAKTQKEYDDLYERYIEVDKKIDSLKGRSSPWPDDGEKNTFEMPNGETWHN